MMTMMKKVGECRSDSLSQDKGCCRQSFPPHCNEAAFCWGFFVKVLWNRFFFWRAGHFNKKIRICPFTHCTEAGLAEVRNFCTLLRLRWKWLPMQSWLIPVKFFKKRSWQGLWKSWNLDGNLDGANANAKCFFWVFWNIFITFSIYNDCYGYLKRFWLKCRELRQKLMLVLCIKSCIVFALEICTEHPLKLLIHIFAAGFML